MKKGERESTWISILSNGDTVARNESGASILKKLLTFRKLNIHLPYELEASLFAMNGW